MFHWAVVFPTVSLLNGILLLTTCLRLLSACLTQEFSLPIRAQRYQQQHTFTANFLAMTHTTEPEKQTAAVSRANVQTALRQLKLLAIFTAKQSKTAASTTNTQTTIQQLTALANFTAKELVTKVFDSSIQTMIQVSALANFTANK